MLRDVLTKEQLCLQEKRRRELLEKLRTEGAPPGAIAEAEKKLKLTRLRLRRLAPEENKKE